MKNILLANIGLKAVFIFISGFISTKGVGQCGIIASDDTVVCVSKPVIQLTASSSGALGYTWTPATGLNNVGISNPIARPTVTTSYIVTSVVPDNVELVINGDFESGNTGFTTSYTYKSNPVPGSNNLSEGQYTVKANPAQTHQCFTACSDKTTGTGNQMIFNGSRFANVAVWTQTITVQPNTDYAFSAWLQNVTCPPYGFNAELQFSVNGNLLGNIFKSDSAVCKWKQFYQIWNSGSSTSATISIVNQYTSLDGNDFALDDISFKKFCNAKDTVTII
ncbi:MAG TPA: hypothetical protein VD908_02645, partial [Cytophagales bacterium]|nr:hypothetical protein [Cytophagales bacterium]